jgi:hypothetical protein
VEVVAPEGPIEPALSGDGHDPAWTSAGYPIFRRLSGTMRQSTPGAETHVEAIRFGFGRNRLFVRIDASTRLDAALRGGLRVALGFLHPPAMRAVAGWSDGRLTCWWERRTEAGEWLPQPDLAPEAAAGTVLELALPLRAFERRHGAEIAFYVALERNGVELGRYPSQVAVKTHVPDGD